MSDYEIYLSDYKDYVLSEVELGIGCVEWKDYTTMESFIDRMLAVMPQALKDQGNQMVFCIATRYVPNPDTDSPDKAIPAGSYFLYCGEGARETAEAAYGPSLRNGVCYSEKRLGRKTDVVPALTEILKAR
jgi:manganese-dependent inorganic pyrophosphatase